MFETHDDLVIRLASGELNEKEAVAAQAIIAKNERLQKLYEQHVCLQRSLQGLNDIPEDQLSIDRLRTAILTSAARPPKRLDWTIGLVLSIGAAACLTLVLTAPKSVPSYTQLRSKAASHALPQDAQTSTTSLKNSALAIVPSQPLVIKSNPASASTDDGDQPARPHVRAKHSAAAQGQAINALKSAGSGLMAVNAAASLASLSSRSGAFGRSMPVSYGEGGHDSIAAGPMMGQAGPPLRMGFAPNAGSQSAAKVSPSSRPDKLAADSRAEKTDRGTLITIQPQKDHRTGLSSAKEEQTPNDVPLGG